MQPLNKITLGTTYYNNPDNIKIFINNHIDFFDEIIIVDDGSSPDYAIEKFVFNKKIRLFKVLKDYGFNSHGCRNLIAKKSSNDWIVLLDSDRLIVDPKTSINYLKNKKLKYNIIYKFVAHAFEIGEGVHESVNDFLISKKHFFSVGGYDEELIGMRTGDREFFKQLDNTGKKQLLYEIDIVLTRRPSLLINNNTIVSKNDKRSDNKILKSLINSRIKKPDPNKPILTFEWIEL